MLARCKIFCPAAVCVRYLGFACDFVEYLQTVYQHERHFRFKVAQKMLFPSVGFQRRLGWPVFVSEIEIKFFLV